MMVLVGSHCYVVNGSTDLGFWTCPEMTGSWVLKGREPFILWFSEALVCGLTV
jgi:predicted nucleic acid-binding Zn finger protein